MKIGFYKYHGTGNDFILVDNREGFFPKGNTAFVSKLCDRRFGIGADGLILLENHPKADFFMAYFNADGRPGSMCGNGGRCIVHFAKQLKIISAKTIFEAIDGPHEAAIDDSMVSLKMKNVPKIEKHEKHVFLNTGSPHHVMLCENLDAFPVATEGRRLRNSLYGENGANINFVQQLSADRFSVRTYERGVEAETLSCGTGVTAVALAMHAQGFTDSTRVFIETPGGELEVRFEKNGKGYENIFLIGNAVQVFKGELKWEI